MTNMGVGGIFHILSDMAGAQGVSLFRAKRGGKKPASRQKSKDAHTCGTMISQIFQDEDKFLVTFTGHEHCFQVPPEWRTDIIVAHASHRKISYTCDRDLNIISVRTV